MNPDLKPLQDDIDKLKEQVQFLMQKRIIQADIVPGAVKMRHIGEGVKFIRSGLEADLPAVGETAMQGHPLYWATDTKTLWIWDGSAWHYVVLT